jgi:hypothetical protein
MPAGFEQLTVQRVNRRLNALQDVRDMPQELKFLKRTPMVPALDNEIMARFVGRAQIADLVADDGVAAVYSLGKFCTYPHEISGASWGMPSQLKVTTATPVQANPTTATMTDEILSLKLVASTQFGIDYNRITMSTAGFRAWIATTEFQNRAKLELRSDIGYTNLSLYDLTKQRMLAQSVLGMEIEFYDARYWSATTAGVIASAPYWPLNKVMLSSTANDNNPMVQDFANGITTESRVMAGFGGGTNTMNAGVIGSFSGGMRGPVGYATLEGMNPPHVTMWNVARGWPRKHILYANAVYDMGTVTDPVSVTEPF